jgi:hypothetical protein
VKGKSTKIGATSRLKRLSSISMKFREKKETPASLIDAGGRANRSRPRCRNVFIHAEKAETEAQRRNIASGNGLGM